MSFRLAMLDRLWFVGLGGTGPYFADEESNWARPIWRAFLDRTGELPAGPEEGFVSPCHSRERDFTFYAGVVYRERPTTFPIGMVCFELPAHQSAVGVVAGDRAEIERVYAELPTWAAGQGRPTTKELLSLERYSAAGPTLDDSGVFDFEVWIPIDSRATDPSDRERPLHEVSHMGLPAADTASAASSS